MCICVSASCACECVGTRYTCTYVCMYVQYIPAGLPVFMEGFDGSCVRPQRRRFCTTVGILMDSRMEWVMHKNERGRRSASHTPAESHRTCRRTWRALANVTEPCLSFHAGRGLCSQRPDMAFRLLKSADLWVKTA